MPFAARICSAGKMVFERIAGSPFPNGFTVSLLKNKYINYE